MKRTLCFFLILLVLPLAAACIPRSETPQWTLESTRKQLVRGETHKNDVYRAFGAPQSVLFPEEMSRTFSQQKFQITPPENSVEFWTYEDRRIRNTFYLNPAPIDHRTTVMTLYFDRNGTLLDYVVRETIR